MLQGKAIPPKPENVSDDEWDKQNWKNRAHIRDDKLFVPGGAIRQCISATAAYLSIKKKGISTWTKHFDRGILVPNAMVLDASPDDIECVSLFIPSDGKRGGGRRVWRRFPAINKWSGEVDVYVIDTSIPKEVFIRVATGMGMFSGLGSMRVGNGGEGGMFDTEVLSWVD